jgi:hypothetical protein
LCHVASPANHRFRCDDRHIENGNLIRWGVRIPVGLGVVNFLSGFRVEGEGER